MALRLDKIMSAQLKAAPQLKISSPTREEVLGQILSCRSISTAIEAGFLDSVRDNERFTQLI